MIYKIFNINDMTQELADRYFQLISDVKKKQILNAKDKIRAAQAFVADMLARQCLSELLDAPEFSFSLLLNPDSRSIVSNFDAQISIATAGEYVGCAVSRMPVGIALEIPGTFSFGDAQALLSDSEIRNIFSYSKYTFSELVRADICKETVLCEQYAMYKALKTAQFNCSGRGIREKKNVSVFSCIDNKYACSNSEYTVMTAEFLHNKQLAVAIIERCS